MTITHENDLAEMGRMLAVISELRAELAQQQAHAEAQAARIETLEEQNAKLKAALESADDEPTRCPVCEEYMVYDGVCHSALCPSATAAYRTP